MDSPEIRDIITRAANGDADALTELLTRYQPPLYGYFLRATRHVHDAEDLLGEMAAKLIVALKKYDDRGRFENWLFRIAGNLVRDRGRKRQRRGVPISLAGTEEFPPIDPPADSAGAADGLIRTEQTGALQQALAELDDTTRGMLVGRYFEQISFRELAEQFDCPIGTVLARVHRAIKKLRTRLEELA
jgi:RNA polymerase sigma-70 factor, ECF subfamily